MTTRSFSRLGRVLAVVGFALAVLAPAAAAQTYPTPSTTSTTVICNSGTVQVCGTSVSAAPATTSQALAFTGGQIALLVVIGLAAVGLGVVLVRLGRRRAGVAAG